MNVLVVEPGYLPYEKEVNSLEEEQAVVGGLIQPIYPFKEEVAVVCNEDGISQGLPFNRSVPGGYGGVFGTFFVCGLGEESFCSLTPEQMAKYKKLFNKSEILLGVKGNDPFTLKVPSDVKKAENRHAHEHKHSDPER